MHAGGNSGYSAISRHILLRFALFFSCETSIAIRENTLWAEVVWVIWKAIGILPHYCGLTVVGWSSVCFWSFFLCSFSTTIKQYFLYFLVCSPCFVMTRSIAISTAGWASCWPLGIPCYSQLFVDPFHVLICCSRKSTGTITDVWDVCVFQ